jgi:hypothetical protein
MDTQWQTRPRLIKAVNIITRTSHSDGFYYGRYGFYTQWQTRHRLIKAINIITRTSHYGGFFCYGRCGFYTQWQTRPSARPGRTRSVAREAHPAEVAALCGIISYTRRGVWRTEGSKGN